MGFVSCTLLRLALDNVCDWQCHCKTCFLAEGMACTVMQGSHWHIYFCHERVRSECFVTNTD